MTTLGYKQTAEARANTSAALKGRTLSAEHKAKIAEAQRRRMTAPAERAKIAEALHGRTGELHPSWQADDISYRGAHRRPVRALTGQPCFHADNTCKGPLHCAFNHDTPSQFVKVDPATGFPYSPRAEDYIPLCQSHHRRYDGNQDR